MHNEDVKVTIPWQMAVWVCGAAFVGVGGGHLVNYALVDPASTATQATRISDDDTKKLEEILNNIHLLHEQIAILTTQNINYTRMLQDHETRLRIIEHDGKATQYPE